MRELADGALLTNYQNFLYELQGDAQQTFAMEYPLLAELSGALANGGYDPGYTRYTRGIAELSGDRETFHGSKVRFPLQLAELPSGGYIAEGATWNAAAPIDTSAATANLVEFVQPVVLSLALSRDAENGSTAAMSAVEMYTRSAFRQVAWAHNVALHGDSTGLIVNVASATGSGTLVVDVGTSSVPWDILQPGRVVDILTRSNGADPGNGKRRKIASVVRSTGLITFSTTQVASDGGSGNITFSSNEGIYISGSRNNAIAGLSQACATTGTFEGIDKAAVAQWQGIKTTASAALSDTILDDAVYQGRGNGAGGYDFGIAHPKVIDLYKSQYKSQVRLEMQETTVQSGFKGIIYQGGDKPFPLIKDLSAPRKICRLIVKDALQLFGDAVGPEFIQDDGSMWRLFNRATLKEADLLDRVQLGVKKCNVLVEIGTVTEAA